MESSGQSRPAWVRVLLAAEFERSDPERVDLAIIRDITFLCVAITNAASIVPLYLAHFWLASVVAAVLCGVSMASYLLSRRGQSYRGAVLLVLVANAAIPFALAEHGSGRFEVVHVLPIALPFTLFSLRRWRSIAVSLAMALGGVALVQLDLVSLAAPRVLGEAGVGELVAGMGVCSVVAGQMWGFFLVRNGALGRLSGALAVAQEADEAKDAFLANISHEIRTPMNGVLGMLDLLQGSPLGGAQRRRVEAAHAQAMSLLPAIDRLLRPEKFEPTYNSAGFDTAESGRRSLDAPLGVPEPGPATPSRRPRVLVVDDNMVNLKVAERMLRHVGCEVDVASTAREAISRTADTSYDVVFMDVQMPQMDGLEATAKIRERERAQGRPRQPIVALTAHAMAGDRERYLAAGMDDYLSKPVEREQLEQAVRRWPADESVPQGLP